MCNSLLCNRHALKFGFLVTIISTWKIGLQFHQYHLEMETYIKMPLKVGVLSLSRQMLRLTSKGNLYQDDQISLILTGNRM